MKKIKLNYGKLQLKKNIVGNLSEHAMRQVMGGVVLQSTELPCTNYPTNQCVWSVNGYCDSVAVCGTGTACGTGACTLINTCPGWCY